MHFRFKYINKLKVKGCEKIYCTNSNHKRGGLTTYVFDKIDFKVKIVTRDRNNF